MPLIIDPPVNAIPVYPWMKAQLYYLSVLETVRASQAAIDPDFDFVIVKNQVIPFLADKTKTLMVNSLIGNRADEKFTIHGKDVAIQFMFELIARANDEGSFEAGEIVLERGQYLAAMIEFAVNALYNNNTIAGFDVGSMAPRASSVTFINPMEIRKTESLFSFGTVNYEVVFHMDYADYIGLPALQLIQTNISNNVYQFQPVIV